MLYLARPSLAKTYGSWSFTMSRVVLKGPERHSGPIRTHVVELLYWTALWMLATTIQRLSTPIDGSEKNRLWCVANGMSSKQRYSKCSKWPPCCAEIQPMSQQDASTTRPYRRLVLNTREKMKKMKHCAFYKVVWWHSSAVQSKGVTVCFLLR